MKIRPTCSTTLPAAPTDRTLDYAEARDEFKGLYPGDEVLAVEPTQAWQQVMVSLDELVVPDPQAVLGQRVRERADQVALVLGRLRDEDIKLARDRHEVVLVTHVGRRLNDAGE